MGCNGAPGEFGLELDVPRPPVRHASGPTSAHDVRSPGHTGTPILRPVLANGSNVPAPSIDVGRPWIALLVALGALGLAVWLFAGADEAALARPTVADRLEELAARYEDDAALLVVPTELPPEWREPGLETARAGSRLERFELRLIRRFENPDREGAFIAVRAYVCTAADPAPCLDGRVELARSVTGGLTTVVSVDDERFADRARAAWADVVVTSDWRSVDWTTRLR